MSEWKRICCAVDFSDESRFAMEEATELASRSKGDLAVIHVAGERPLYHVRLPYRSELSPTRTGDVARQLEEWRNAAERIAETHVFASLLSGTPVGELPSVAENPARRPAVDLVQVGGKDRKFHAAVVFPRDYDAKKKYPEGWRSPRPYIRIVPQPGVPQESLA